MVTSITFSKLGKHGRLGNQIFQFSLLFSLSKKFNKLISLPNRNIELFKCFELPNYNNYYYENNKKYFELEFNFNKNIFNEIYCDYHGYFQSEKYFSFITEELKNLLKFKEEHTKINNPKQNSCFIHVRRTDYLKYASVHHNLSKKYYLNILEKEYNNYDFFYFLSDDIDWCKNNFSDTKYKFIECQNQYQDLFFMTQCDGAILANSSFSWWGAWLGKEKKVIAPKQWFGPKGPTNFSDIYCKNWIIKEDNYE